jgi:hypothetical protein
MTWYEADHARLVIEYLRVSARYPKFVLKRTDEGVLYWLGKIELTVGVIHPPVLQLRIEYPDSFPAIYPDAFVMEPSLSEDHLGHKWHRWPSTGAICYVKPKIWQLGTTADEVISKCEDWYFNYIAATNGLIDEMPEVGRAVLKG